MKRYKLLKDLAGVKAGSTLYLNELGNLVAEDKTTIVFLANFIHFYNILDSDWLEENPEGHRRWRADKEGPYWYVSSYGEARGATCGCMELYDSTDNYRYSIGNYFKTGEEAEKAVNWLKAFTILRDDTKGFRPDWKNTGQARWFVFYDRNSRRLRSDLNFTFQDGNLYFASEDEANESIKNHQREWLALFGVEE